MRTAPGRLHGNQPPFFPSQRVVKRQRRILQIYSPRPFKVDFPHAPGKIIPQKFSEYVLAFPYQKGIRIKGAFPLHMRGMDASQRHIRPSCTVSLGVTVGASSRGSNRIHTYQIEIPLRKRKEIFVHHRDVEALLHSNRCQQKQRGGHYLPTVSFHAPIHSARPASVVGMAPRPVHFWC